MAAMTRARARLVMEHPFFGDLALRLVFKEDSSCRDLWTDGNVMGFNPAYASVLPAEKLVGAQAHEVMHLAFGHHLRRRDRDRQLWNRACDIAINELLLDSGFQLPDGFVRERQHAGRSADEIYAILARDLIEEVKKKGRQAPNLGATDKNAKSQGALPKRGSMQLGESQASSGGNRGDGKKNESREGPGAGAQASENADARKSGRKAQMLRFDGEVRDMPDLEGSDGEKARKNAEQARDIAVTQALNRARRMGSIPAGVSRLIAQVLVPALDWRDILRRFLDQCADSDYTWTVPNRRYLYQDIYMPSRMEQRLPHVAMAVDSSGSVDEKTLALFCGELESVLDAYETTLTVLFHDTKVQKVETFSRMDMPLRLAPKGGGGTDFRPIPQAISDLGINPACLIWFTDLECTRFPEDPGYPVLWVASGAGGETPPFGEIVRMNKTR